MTLFTNGDPLEQLVSLHGTHVRHVVARRPQGLSHAPPSTPRGRGLQESTTEGPVGQASCTFQNPAYSCSRPAHPNAVRARPASSCRIVEEKKPGSPRH